MSALGGFLFREVDLGFVDEKAALRGGGLPQHFFFRSLGHTRPSSSFLVFFFFLLLLTERANRSPCVIYREMLFKAATMGTGPRASVYEPLKKCGANSDPSSLACLPGRMKPDVLRLGIVRTPRGLMVFQDYVYA